VSVCSRLCGVAEQNSAGVPARDPDRLIRWFIRAVVTGVGVNLLSGSVVTQKWAWLPPAVFAAALLVAVPSTWSSTARALSHNAGARHGFARADRLSGGRGWGSVTGWPLSVMILSLVYLWEAGVMLTWSTLRSRADLDHVALGTACLLLGSALLLLGVANPLDARAPGMVAGLLVRDAFLLLGVGALVLGVAALLDRWTLLGVPFPMFAVAAMLGGAVALLAGLTLLGVALLLFGVAFLLGGVAALLDGWSLVGVPFLLLGVAALLGGVAALLDEWTVVGVPFLLLGIAALLGGVALLYRPELPRRLVAWLTRPRQSDTHGGR
jgi:hypothetical protein